MLQRYMTIMVRNIRRRAFSATINILGLTVGLASCILIGWYVLDESSYDNFHVKPEKVFRVNTYWGDNPSENIYATTPPPLYHRLKEIPEIKYAARAFSWNHSTMRLPDEEGKDEKVFRETKIFIVDPEFLQVLDFNIIAGDPTQAFNEPNSIVITRETAVRYFGEVAIINNEVIGKSILFGGSKAERIISAIVDPPSNTHFHFDMLVNIKMGYQGFASNGNWVWNIMHTYVRLEESVVDSKVLLQRVQKKVSYIAQNYGLPFLENKEFGGTDPVFDYRLQAVQDIHLTSHFLRELEANGSTVTVEILMVIAFLIALLACVNFMNLSTAQYSYRVKEIGIRKLMGSKRISLISQFLLESLTYSFVAGILALGIVELFREQFNLITGKQLEFDWLNHPLYALMILLTILIVGFLSGLYPAFYLTSANPSVILKSKGLQGHKSSVFRNSLVIFQFTVSIILIVCTIMIYKQVDFIRNKQLGYNKENVLVIKNDREVDVKWKDLKSELNKISGITENSFCTSTPTMVPGEMRDFRLPQSLSGTGISRILVDESYIPLLDMQLVAGHNFRKSVASDVQAGLILNESAVKALDLIDPIGTEIIKNQGAEDEERLEIIAVVKDYISESFLNQIKPMAWQYFKPNQTSDFILVRMSQGNTMEQLNNIREVWRRYEPDTPFTYTFLDKEFDALYKAEQRLGKVFNLFSGLAIFIAILGLFGLITFTGESKVKEIGIRKVLGASAARIVLLLSKNFTVLITIAFVVSIPLAYLATTYWLEQFTYRVDIDVSVFMISGLIAFGLAWLVMIFQTLKSASNNPVDSLKND